MTKTAVFGGAFDPVHNEHVNVVKSAVAELQLERVVLVPTYSPPHKSGAECAFADRVNMLKLALDGLSAEIIVDETERNDEERNYAVEVIPKLKAKYGEFYYLMGGDSLAHFESWYKPKEIVKMTRLAVFNREGYPNASKVAEGINERLNTDALVLDYCGKSVSSSDIKAHLLLGEDTDTVPPCVLAYIREHNLFSRFLPAANKLEEEIGERKYVHSKNVVYEAVRLNSYHNLKLPFDKVFIAALLHDNCKYAKSPIGVPQDAIGTEVEHQFSGAVNAKDEYGVTDEEVLDAIRYHTTAKPDMTLLGKVVYVADKICEGRTYSSVDKLRQAAYNDFEKGFVAVLADMYRHLIESGEDVYPLTKVAYDYYFNK